MSAEVIKKASELAQAIAQSEELSALRAAEAKLQNDQEAMELLQKFKDSNTWHSSPELLRQCSSLNPHRYTYPPHPYQRKKAVHLVAKILKVLNIPFFRNPKPLPGGQPWN